MRHLGQFSTTVTIIVILLAALLVMIVLQLSCLKIGIATKGIFGPEHFLALLKKCQVWLLENKSIIELDNACQAKVGQRTYKQLLVIIIILSLFSYCSSMNMMQRKTGAEALACKYLDTPSW